MRFCDRSQCALGISSALMFTIAILILVLGYVVPKSQFDGYSPKLCKCLGTNITNTGSPYYGYALLQYNELTKCVLIIGSKSLAVVQNYLNVNFPKGAHVACYVSNDDIEISMFTSIIAIIGGTLMFVIGSFILMLLIVYTIRRRKRRFYTEFESQGASSPRVSASQEVLYTIDLL